MECVCVCVLVHLTHLCVNIHEGVGVATDELVIKIGRWMMIWLKYNQNNMLTVAVTQRTVFVFSSINPSVLCLRQSTGRWRNDTLWRNNKRNSCWIVHDWIRLNIGILITNLWIIMCGHGYLLKWCWYHKCLSFPSKDRTKCECERLIIPDT